MTTFVAGTTLTASALNTAFAPLSPIGSITLWAGSSASLPTGYVLCDGSTYATTGTYADLFAVLQYRYGGAAGSFAVPKLNADYVPLGTSTLNANLSRQNLTISTGNTASSGHTHTFGTTVNNTTQSSGHTHTITTNNTGADHFHSGTTGDANLAHQHNYAKPNGSSNTQLTVTALTNHAHNFSTGNANAFNHVHNVAVNATNADTAHAHNATTVANATNADTTHAHTVTGSYVVYIIRYA